MMAATKLARWSSRIAIAALLRENARLRRRLIAALARITQLEARNAKARN